MAKKKSGSKKPRKHPLRDKLRKLAEKLKHPFMVLLDIALAPGKLAMFAPMMPFIGMMELDLKRKGIKVPGSKLDHLENLCRQFYQVNILKKEPLIKGVGLADKHLEHWESQFNLENVQFEQDVHEHFNKYGTKNKYGKLIKQHLECLEHADEADSSADKLVDKGADAVSKAGLVGSIVGTAIKIIHGIISFITGMKKKKAAQALADAKAKGAQIDAQQLAAVALDPVEKAVLGKTPVDNSMLGEADKVQNVLAKSVGGEDANGNVNYVNEKGEVSHILKTDGSVIETGAKPSAHITGRDGIFGWIFYKLHKKAA